jgi:hypothetical protein
MSGPEAGRAARIGGLIFAGAALLAVGAAGLQWSMAPALLRAPVIEFLFIAAGATVLVIGLVSLALERRAVAASRPVPSVAPSPRRAASATPSPPSSLMTLPAVIGENSSPGARPTPTGPAPAAPFASPASNPAPVAVAAEGPSNSTLLIPFADGLRSVNPPPAPSAADQTVSTLVGRMDAVQRAAPSSPGPAAGVVPIPKPRRLASPLLLRLTRIPAPPAASAAALAARRCTDCGEPFGTPPQFEPCEDCGRALCERCYWRTSSGPQAHLCTTCFKDRSVPRPPAPSPTFGQPGPAASISMPAGRPLRPRRPVN